MNRTRLLPLLVIGALLALPGAGRASGEPRAEPGTGAVQALREAERLLGHRPSAAVTGAIPGREATLVLRDLSHALPALSGERRRRAEAILSRPSERSDQFGDYFGREAAGSPICDASFCVHWSRRAKHRPSPGDSDGNGSPDYAAAVLDAAATSRAVENGALGWRRAKPDGANGARAGRGADGQVDIYIRNLGRGLFGYAASDPGSRGRKRPGYLVVDNDYAGFDGKPLDLMRVTIAHEYNHILQFAYDSFQDGWLFEATATWIEEYVYPEIDDYLNFLGPFTKRPHRPLAEPDRRASRLYGSAMWNHWLASRLGPGVVRETWAVSAAVRPASFAVAAYDRAIGLAGGHDLSREFAAFAAVSAEWNASPAFPDPGSYPDMKRSGRLEGARKIRLDHTAYRLFRVRGVGGKRLTVRAQRGTRSAIALVGRSGSPAGGTVEIVSKYMRRGGRARVALPDAGSYSRVTAVVVNADGRVSGARDYSRDGRRFRLRLTG